MNYNLISQSIFYYKANGFTYIDVPWLVDPDISDVTKPADKQNFLVKGEAIVGSAEQSFMQLIRDRKLNPGQYVTCTACFRDDELDEIHQRYFMKTELIVYGPSEEELEKHLRNVTALCMKFFSQYLNVETVIDRANSNSTINYDIIDTATRIELGSYGIRKVVLPPPRGLDETKVDPEIPGMPACWLYATGCAEPRLSTVIAMNRKLGYHSEVIPKSRIGTFFKLVEEFEELKDAHLGQNKVMELVELSDLYGAMDLYLRNNYPSITMEDLNKMNKVTQRAFINGRRS